VGPTAIQPHQRASLIEQKFVVFRTKHLAAKRFEDDALFWERAHRFVQLQISAFVGKNRRVFPGVVLCKPQRMDGNLQKFTPCC